jgi:hypothetical protein
MAQEGVRRGHLAAAFDGYCPSKSQFVWGVRLVLVSDAKGVPLGYDLVDPKTGRERECAFELAQAHPGAALFCDRGFWAPEYERTMELIDIELVTPDKHKLDERPESELAKARIRLVIESVISNLKGQLRQNDHLAKTLRGLIQRIAQRRLPHHRDLHQPAHRSPRKGARRL